MDERRKNRFGISAALGGLAFVVLGPGLAAPAAALDPARIPPALVSIGTGGKTGVYYLAGGAICGLVNDRRWTTGQRCLTEASDGTIQNLRDVRSGARTFGIVQSDGQYDAVKGTGAFREQGPDRELRAVMSLFPEPFTVVARPDAGIAVIRDLAGKRVNFGPSGSGGRSTMAVVSRALGWTDGEFAWVGDLAMPDVPRALCAGEIDAAVFIVAHPNLTVEDMISTCDAVLVPVTGPEIDRLIAENEYFAPSEIAAGTYADQPTGAATFALTATLVTSARTPSTIVYNLTKAVLDDLDTLRAAHPALADLDAARMSTDGLTAPLHDGARRAFDEAAPR
jgi:TRAP transporter TAXI family solute receptor